MTKRILFVAVCALVSLAANAEALDLSDTETANCYMVPSGRQSYSFNALVKGNGIAPYGEPTAIPASQIKSVKLLWQDAEIIDASSVRFSKDRIFFKTRAEVLTGNAVIAIYSDKECSDGSCIWSWHIWMTDAKDCRMAGFEFLDRNLGADGTGLQENGRNGLFYQWGRKDPFSQTGALEKTIYCGKVTTGFLCSYPQTFVSRDGRIVDINEALWCKASTGQDSRTVRLSIQTKTMYDPCPPGYHVPNYCDIALIKASGSHSFVKAGARWYDVQPADPDKVGESGYYWCATIGRNSRNGASDFYLWSLGIGLGSHYYNSSAFCVRPQKFYAK